MFVAGKQICEIKITAAIKRILFHSAVKNSAKYLYRKIKFDFIRKRSNSLSLALLFFSILAMVEMLELNG